MTAHEAIDIPGAQPPAARTAQAAIPDDMEMLRAAVDLTRDLSTARPGIYWPDMLLSAGIGYAGLAVAILARNPAVAVAAGIIAAVALYRALLFIHELTHSHRTALPGFRLGWNLLVDEPYRLPMLNALVVPDGIDEANLRARLLNEYQIEISGGLGALAGKIVRVGLMGYNAKPESIDRLLAGMAEILL